MTLFAVVPAAPPVFAAALQKYFDGRPDALTAAALAPDGARAGGGRRDGGGA